MDEMDQNLMSSLGFGSFSSYGRVGHARRSQTASSTGESPAPAIQPQARPRLSHSTLSRSANRPTSSYSDASASVTRPSTASGRKSRATNASSILGNSEAYDIVCAVCEARGVSPSVGVAFVNISLGEAVLSQICDNQSYVKTVHKVQMARPSRIVCMSSAKTGSQPSTIMSLLRGVLPDIPIDESDRAAYSEAKGIASINKLAFEADVQPIQVALQGKYYAICSFAAVRHEHAQIFVASVFG